MIEAMETLLLAWGAEVISPRLDVSIRSPLAAMSDDAPGGGTGGSRCLSTVECAVVMSRATAAVAAALLAMASDEPAGLGSRGRVLRRLADLRYAEHPRLQVADQCRFLAVSVRTYRTRVDELHVELALALPGVLAARVAAERTLPAYAAAQARTKKAKAAERESVAAVKRRRAAGKAYGRALLASKDGAA
jgi:hypothetical protein